MRVTIHLNKSYDWVKVPSDVVVTPADVASGKAKIGTQGEYLMKVPKPGDTHTTILLSEQQLLAKIVHEKCRPEGGRTLSRAQAVAFYVGEHCLATEAHRSWVKGVEVHDSGHEISESGMTDALALHVEAGNIPADDVKAHLDAYLATADSQALADHLTKHFRVGK